MEKPDPNYSRADSKDALPGLVTCAGGPRRITRSTDAEIYAYPSTVLAPHKREMICHNCAGTSWAWK